MTRRKLLIVDDNAANRMILRGMFKDEYDIAEAENGKIALDILYAAPDDISVVLLDIIMPVMDGYEMLKAMREDANLSAIPVIITTGSTDERTEIKALTLGANDFVGKPYNFAIARHRIRNVIHFRETAATLNATRRDELTGLPSRKAFFEKAEDMIRSREAGCYVLSAMDIDNFKVVNDQFGNAHGDELLRHIARTLSEGFDAIGGVCCRMTADRFAALYPRDAISDEEIARILARAATFDADMPAVTISTGKYIVTETDLGVSAMYDRTVIAQSLVKGRFDAHTAVYDEKMRENILREQEIVNEMTDALRSGQFEPWYQPQFNHETGALIGAEALVRWRHPVKGLISPDRFIPVFERNGFIYAMDRFIWDNVCARMRRWMDEGRAPLPVSVNISRFDLFRDDFFDTVVSIIHKHGVPVHMLHLEITESAFVSSGEHMIAIVKKLTDYGFIVEIDDFGSGYSSLNTLKDVPANMLKLDLRFLESDGTSQRGGSILESVVRMARWLGMPVIAEGVETIEQAEYLKSIGCLYVQGYLYSRPLPADEYERMLSVADGECDAGTSDAIGVKSDGAFWDASSAETLLFSSYAGSACIMEYQGGNVEFLRVNDKYTREVFGENPPSAHALTIHLIDYADEGDRARMRDAVDTAARKGVEVVCEVRLSHLPGVPAPVCLLFEIRRLAHSSDRWMLYANVRNITAQREAERRLRDLAGGEAPDGSPRARDRDDEERKNTLEQLKVLTDNLPCGIAKYEISASSRRLTYFSDGFCRLLGYTRAEYERLAREKPLGRMPAEDAVLLRAQSERAVRDGTPIDCIYRVRTGDGSIKWLNSRGAPQRRESGVTILNTAVFDVTARMRAEEKLRMSEEQYRLAIEHSGDIICRYDISDASLTMSDESAAIFGAAARAYDVPSSVVRQGKVSDETRDDYVRVFAEIRRGVKNGSASVRFLTRNGWRWFELRYSTVFSDSGEPAYAVISLSDITRRREQEDETAALKERERVFRMVAEHSSRSICRYDVKTKTLTAELPGRSPGAAVIDAETPEIAIARGNVLSDSAEDYRAVFRAIEAGVAAGSAKIHMRAPDGSPRWIDLKYSLFTDRDGKPQTAVLSLLDITNDHEKELAFERYRQAVGNDRGRDDVIFFDTDLTADCVETVGGKLPEFAFPEAGGRHDQTVRAGMTFLPDKYHEDLWTYFSRERLLASFAEGKRELTHDWSIDMDNKTLCYHTEIQMIEDPFSGHIRAYTTLRDVTDEKLDMIDLQKQAETDGMTGLYNKATTESLVRRALKRPGGAPCTMMIADLDNLKLINDTMGHPHGDSAIRQLADMLKAQFRRGDIVGRIGGDEMLVFLSGAGDQTAITHAMDSFMRRLSDTRIIEDDSVRLRASIGIAIGRSGVNTFEELYRRADQALYEVKRKGKDGYAFYTPGE